MLDTNPTVEIINLIIRAATPKPPTCTLPEGKWSAGIHGPQDIMQALKRARQYQAMCKQEGRPGPQHRVSELWHQASRSVWASQRRHTAHKREMIYWKIMDAEVNDQRLFHRLIREHQSSPLGAKVIMDGLSPHKRGGSSRCMSRVLCQTLNPGREP